jgi:hypothetical protein
MIVSASLGGCGSCTTRWRQTGDMTVPRYGHTATLLSDGTVLVTGGFTQTVLPGPTGGPITVLDSAERFDPASRTWSFAGHMSSPRAGHAAVTLDDGTVLVIGGITEATGPPTPVTASVDRFDPVRGTWSASAPLNQPRATRMAVNLRNGDVLVIGGDYSGNNVSLQRSVERFVLALNRWEPAESLPDAHELGSASLLDDGSVIVAGGAEYSPVQALVGDSFTFDPFSGHWGEWALLNDVSLAHSAVKLNDGTVLLTAGLSRGESKAVMRFNRAFAQPNVQPQPKLWQNTADLANRRADHRATLLRNGDVLVTGGYQNCNLRREAICLNSLSSVEQYHPIMGAPPNDGLWTTIDSMWHSRGRHTATLLNDGSVLVAGGFDWNRGIALSASEILPP